MVTHPPHPAAPPVARVMVAGFPNPGPALEQAYDELNIAQYGTDTEKRFLPPLRAMPRPWDPPTCTDPDLRAQLWEWLEQVVTWLNREYVWDTDALIPTCWPLHPHLVHEIAGLADGRRRAGHALSGEGLEEWHRYALPAFTDRMRARLKTCCTDGRHQPWPATSRHTRHLSEAAVADRAGIYAADVATLTADTDPPSPSGQPRLRVIGNITLDPATGEVIHTSDSS